jgi:ATP-binding cassette subfamily B protein
MDAGAVQSVLLLGLLAGLLALVLFRADTSMDRVEDAVYVIAAYLVVHGYLRNIGWQVRTAQRGINELDDLVEIAKTDFQVGNLSNAEAFRPGTGQIRFEAVRFGYINQPAPIFDDLSVIIQPGEKVALVGESGSGKSTFAKLIQRLYDLDAGRIVIDDQDVSTVTQESLRSTISIVPQEPILFHRSLAENIAYGNPQATDCEIHEAARKPMPMSSSIDSSKAMRRWSASAGSNSRAANASGLRLLARPGRQTDLDPR